MGFTNCSPRLASDLNPPDLNLLRSKDYRPEPLALTMNLFLEI
jgi:hypothetical protein